jgi:hypothetical protein
MSISYVSDVCACTITCCAVFVRQHVVVLGWNLDANVSLGMSVDF